MKSAEFTDHATASAFLTAGRKKGERSTSDGWNTVLYERGADFVLELHGTEIVRYTPSETRITIPMRNHVVADRVQRYGFADKFLLNTGTKWSLSQAWGKMTGIVEDPTIWFPVLAEVPTLVDIDSTGGLVSPMGAPMPAFLNPSMRAQIWDPAIKKWLTSAMKLLDAGWDFSPAEWKLCPLCDSVENKGAMMLGQYASSTHLLSHVLEGIVLPSTVVGLLAANGVQPVLDLTVDPFGDGRMGTGGPSGRYNHDAVRRYLKNALRAATR